MHLLTARGEGRRGGVLIRVWLEVAQGPYVHYEHLKIRTGYACLGLRALTCCTVKVESDKNCRQRLRHCPGLSRLWDAATSGHCAAASMSRPPLPPLGKAVLEDSEPACKESGLRCKQLELKPKAQHMAQMGGGRQPCSQAPSRSPRNLGICLKPRRHSKTPTLVTRLGHLFTLGIGFKCRNQSEPLPAAQLQG